jgi:hypothetical protein
MLRKMSLRHPVTRNRYTVLRGAPSLGSLVSVVLGPYAGGHWH